MHRTLARSGAILASVTLASAGVLAGATAATAGQLDGAAPDAPLVFSVSPVDPQPIVPGHEGDVLLRVSIAMPGTTAAKHLPPTARKVVKTSFRKGART